MFQNVFYTMLTTAIGFYLPAALVSCIYFKLFMVFREDLALIIGGSNMLTKSGTNLARYSFLILLNTSAWPCPQKSGNLGPNL